VIHSRSARGKYLIIYALSYNPPYNPSYKQEQRGLIRQRKERECVLEHGVTGLVERVEHLADERLPGPFLVWQNGD
jgi:hypothetical protein